MHHDGVCQRCGTETVHVNEEGTKDEQRWRRIQHFLFECGANAVGCSVCKVQTDRRGYFMSCSCKT